MYGKQEEGRRLVEGRAEVLLEVLTRFWARSKAKPVCWGVRESDVVLGLGVASWVASDVDAVISEV